jgi:DNA ligase (NAD+)
MKLSEIYKALENKEFSAVSDQIKKFNEYYRNGEPLITDSEYDNLVEKLKNSNPNDEIFKSGVIESIEVDSDRKETLKYPMFSLDKETSIEEVKKWLVNKGVPLNTELIITAKYDGISILKDETNNLAWSRGDGFEGETMHEHYKKLKDKGAKLNMFTIGEMIIPKPIFNSRTFYRESGEAFKNSRNMIAGLKNSDKISEDLKYAKHIRYGFANEDFTKNKSEQLDIISNKLSNVPYKKFKANELDVEKLNELYNEWNKEYDIDGLVIDIDDKNIRKNLGREKNNNPAYSRAFKNPDWSETAETTIIDIEWNVSKNGLLKPVGLLRPINLEGVTVSRVTLNNAKYVKDMNLGINSVVSIKRSGNVIPKIVEVIKPTGFKMPKIKDFHIFWNENEVELCIKGTDEQQIKKIVSFFEILKTDNVSEGTIKQLYDHGFKTIGEILNLTKTDLERVDRFGVRKAKIVYDSIKKATTNVSLSKLMHASNLFNSLGSKKLELLVHFKEKPSYDEIIKIEGFSDTLATNFLEGYDKFKEFIKDLPITIEKEKEKNNNDNSMNNDLTGMSVLFTGVRRQDLVDVILSRGGKNLSAISKNVTHLICKDKNSNSSKMVKAKELGIRIMDVKELEDFLNS